MTGEVKRREEKRNKENLKKRQEKTEDEKGVFFSLIMDGLSRDWVSQLPPGAGACWGMGPDCAEIELDAEMVAIVSALITGRAGGGPGRK